MMIEKNYLSFLAIWGFGEPVTRSARPLSLVSFLSLEAKSLVGHGFRSVTACHSPVTRVFCARHPARPDPLLRLDVR